MNLSILACVATIGNRQLLDLVVCLNTYCYGSRGSGESGRVGEIHHHTPSPHHLITSSSHQLLGANSVIFV